MLMSSRKSQGGRQAIEEDGGDEEVPQVALRTEKYTILESSEGLTTSVYVAYEAQTSTLYNHKLPPSPSFFEVSHLFSSSITQTPIWPC